MHDLPKPTAARVTHFSMSEPGLVPADMIHALQSIGFSVEPLVTMADLLAERKAIIELCANLCEGLRFALDNGGNTYLREATATRCAAAIRALLEE
jgi:hypothetical protein